MDEFQRTKTMPCCSTQLDSVACILGASHFPDDVVGAAMQWNNQNKVYPFPRRRNIQNPTTPYSLFLGGYSLMMMMMMMMI
ncbi:unnamed protein product [Periconia digitata]|uniref:Uncharacterized protein n=1 Tax=Periconia digitata TaxID=1303443 RepID=A0A9W4XMY5_9PLEO|nr:unnamed protein product [Periconia digitata]